MIVVPGRNYVEGAQSLSRVLGAEALNVSYKMFPDGEKYVRVENSEKLKGSVAIVANTMYPSQDDSLVETLMLINASVKAGASKVVACIPYLAYARQDRVFLPGEPISAEIVLRAIYGSGANCLVTVDIHSLRVVEGISGCFKNVVALDLLFSRVRGLLVDPVVISPDEGSIHRARQVAERHGLQHDYLVKERDRETGEISISPREVSVHGREVVIVDDIISTGETISRASKMLLDKGARKVVVCASHGLLIGNALEKMKKSGVSKVVLANTLGLKFRDQLIEYVDVCERVAAAIREVVES